jgi:tetratricopeptide (TPR) repeat protein
MMLLRSSLLTAAAVLAGIGLPGSVRAAPPALVASHCAAPTDEDRARVAVVHRALATRTLPPAAVTARLGAHLGRATAPLAPEAVSAALEAIRQGAEASYAGDWSRAVDRLHAARKALRSDPLSLARDQSLLPALQRARLLLAMAHLRSGAHREAWTLVEEALRAQPDLNPSSALYGPELLRLFVRVKAQLELARSTLAITTDPPGALVFVDGRSVGFSPVTLRDLLPGDVEVLVVKDRAHSRIRRVALGRTPVKLSVSLALDAALRPGPPLALDLPAGPDRAARERALLAELGRILGTDRVIVVGQCPVEGRPALVARLVRLGRADAAALAYVHTDQGEPAVASLINLGLFLAGAAEPPGPPVVVVSPVAGAPARPAVRPGPGLRVGGWTLLGAGLIAAGVGGFLVGIDGQQRWGAIRRADIYDTDVPGYALLGAGLGVAVTGAILLGADAARRRRWARAQRRTGLGVTLLPTRGGAFLGAFGRF